MKTKLLLLVFFLLSINKIYSQSDEFTYVSSDTKGEDYFVLIEKTNENSVELWIKNTVPIKYKMNKKQKKIKTGGGYCLTFVTINCNESSYDLGESISYYENGSVKNKSNFPTFDNKVIPGSIMSSIFNSVCRNN